MTEDLTARLDDCAEDLQMIKNRIDADRFDNIVKYLQQYAIMRACGTIETVVKNMIADHVDMEGTKEVKHYIFCKVRANSANPRTDRISQLLGEFSDVWNKNFKDKLSKHQKEKGSLDSLVSLRNSFAHGQDTDATIDSIIEYFNDSRSIITLVEETMDSL